MRRDNLLFWALKMKEGSLSQVMQQIVEADNSPWPTGTSIIQAQELNSSSNSNEKGNGLS